MQKGLWQLQEAKSRFIELVNTAINKGAQTLTKHGKPAAVVIPVKESQRSSGRRRSLATALRDCPEDLAPFLGKRSKRIARKINVDR